MQRILIKIGGKVFENGQGLVSLAASIRQADTAQYIIVHGGGVEITQALNQANRPTIFENGLRITAAEDMEIIEQVLSEKINSRIASALTNHGVSCTRLSGRTHAMFIVEPLLSNGRSLGYVGKITRVNPAPALDALAKGHVALVSPVSADASGAVFNVNADSAAAALAVHADCTDLIYFTDVPGIRDEKGLISDISLAEANALAAAGIIRDGMVAKLNSAAEALHGKVARVHITRWQGDATLAELTGHNKISGTTIHI
jgi:acetylglutamate kinase